MTVFPFQISEVSRLYGSVSKSKSAARTEREPSEPQDIVRISPEAKKRQALDQQRSTTAGPVGKPR